MTTTQSALMGLVLWMTGCVPSLQPLYTDKDTLFDPALVGTWEGKEESWLIRRSEGNFYQLTVKPAKGAPATFEGRLVELGTARFLDLYPGEPDIQNDLYKMHLVPAHSISRIRLERDTLRVAMLDDSWLRDLIRDQKVQIAHQILKDNMLVLTAATAELQALVSRYADDPKAFADPSEFRRISQ